MATYYNENNKHAAEWLRNLIASGAIPGGIVDDRSIRDVRPADLVGFTQCHFFAGIGGWAHAARLAGWPDTRPLWTGSCPCQPFSVAGKGAGFEDERDLWPTWFELIRAARPDVVMGEQVARKDGAVWFARTRSDLEGTGYAARAVVVPACAVAAPHERERLWFVAHPDAIASVSRGPGDTGESENGRNIDRRAIGGTVAHADTPERWPETAGGHHADRAHPGRAQSSSDLGECRGSGPLAHPDSNGQPSWLVAAAQNGHRLTAYTDGWPGSAQGNVGHTVVEQRPIGARVAGSLRTEQPAVAGTSGGFWGGARWLDCADGKQRRLAPGVALLAHGLRPRDVAGSLAGFGNAIVPQVAAEILGAYLDTYPDNGCSVGVAAPTIEDLLQ